MREEAGVAAAFGPSTAVSSGIRTTGEIVYYWQDLASRPSQGHSWDACGFSGEEIVRYLLKAKNECPVVRGRHYEERPAWLTLAVLSLFGLLVLAAVSCGGGEQRAENPTEDEAQSGSDAGSGEAGSGEEQAAVDLDHPSLGDENAPVVMTEYADYQ